MLKAHVFQVPKKTEKGIKLTTPVAMIYFHLLESEVEVFFVLFCQSVQTTNEESQS